MDSMVLVILVLVVVILAELVHHQGVKYKPKQIPVDKWI
jgi:hypothetical protein